uniref:Uncharacterized protein n=1 Tax=Rhizophora mucronata TaxID=61149 RepID=A0A2P2N7S2_RHIMU
MFERMGDEINSNARKSTKKVNHLLSTSIIKL